MPSTIGLILQFYVLRGRIRNCVFTGNTWDVHVRQLINCRSKVQDLFFLPRWMHLNISFYKIKKKKKSSKNRYFVFYTEITFTSIIIGFLQWKKELEVLQHLCTICFYITPDHGLDTLLCTFFDRLWISMPDAISIL